MIARSAVLLYVEYRLGAVCSIQNSISAIDFDFWEWTLVK
jgi:hypothetical protein